MNPPESLQVRQGGRLCVFCVAGLAFYCLAQTVRELKGRKQKKPADSQQAQQDSPGCPPRRQRTRTSRQPQPLIPKEQAIALVRAVAEKFGSKKLLRTIGNISPKHLAIATAHFAQEMTQQETPLILRDTSFLQNHKSGLLLTNRAIYSSHCRHPIWLCDIEEVIFPPLSPRDPVASLFFGRLYHTWRLSQNMTQQMRVNGELVYSWNPLRTELWIEMLQELAAAARQVMDSSGGGKEAPSLAILETTLSQGEQASSETRQNRNPTWQQIEQSIRALNGDSLPSLRLWVGEMEQALALEILGGNGQYVLRELGDGWTYYDPSGGEEDVQVCYGVAEYRCPAYYVCTHLDRVLEIARHFVETGTPE
ncbi:MAG: hypothetical protein ACYC3I_20475 [Gemmataceae bacterium]